MPAQAPHDVLQTVVAARLLFPVVIISRIRTTERLAAADVERAG